MTQQQPDDLASQLQQALEHYRATWRSADAELYGLCQRRSSHRNFADVYTKVAIIGRVYEAGVARSFQAPGDNEATVASGLIEQAELIEERLNALHARKFDRQTAAEVVELHGRITRKVAERTGDAWLTSFVSKYLHFHCPIVPLYDSNAAGRIGQFVDWQLVTSVRDSLTTLPDWARAYRNFVAAFVILYERAWAETQLQPSVRDIDYLLWQPADQ